MPPGAPLLAGGTQRSATVECAAPACEVVSIPGAEFLRLLEKSSVVRKAMEDLSARRFRQNEEVARRA
jgi:CRP-like cAMP-binding protein